ncbi:MAG: hypothetical protein KF901_10400 [Myxococcales bacterium]|nr:hypothetical protein [Myxococcales bacterium]
MPGTSFGLGALVLVGFAFALVARADGVLHEYVPDAGDEELETILGRGGEPAALVYDDAILTAPTGGARRANEQAMSALPGSGRGRETAGRRSPTFRPDRITSLEESVGYFAVFTPTIAPFKRISALDAVVASDGTPVLGVSSLQTERVPVEGALAPAPDGRPRDRFWGNVVLDFRHGALVPLPSVSPESRILTLRTERLGVGDDEVDIEIHRDLAGSFFASAPPGVRDEVRLIFLTDAPRDYFRRDELPDLPSDLYADEVFPLDPRVRADALRFARELGLSPGASYRRTLPLLVEHFRSFVESDEPPPSTGNIFLDLARGMKGVCRHRAYPFVITAHALGLPARFVQNEAHAWVEVKVPTAADVPGWLRIDLGGSAAGLDAHGTQDRPPHRPLGDDVLPRPEPYVRAYREIAARSPAPMSDPLDLPPASTRPSEASAPSAASPSGSASPPGPAASIHGPRPHARPLRLTVEGRAFEVFRGRRLTLHGRALDPDGLGVEGLRVEVHARGPIERLLGVTVTGPEGRWDVNVGVPQELPVGDYALLVRSPGNERFFPATAR